MRAGRRLARTLAFQTLFEMESRPGQLLDETVANRAATLEEDTGEAPGPQEVDFATRLVDLTLANRSEIDRWIARVAPAFPVDQLATTDRVVLELAMAELLYYRDASVNVIINEAVELAKMYGGENSGRFVNGVLGTIAKELSAGGPHEETPEPRIKSPATNQAIDNTTRR